MAPFNTTLKPRILAALTSAGASAVCFLGLILTIVYPHDFFRIVAAFAWIVAATSTLAGVVRFCIKRESVLLSAICGALIGAAGYFITLFVAVSGI
jgi:hypothetical protein